MIIEGILLQKSNIYRQNDNPWAYNEELRIISIKIQYFLYTPYRHNSLVLQDHIFHSNNDTIRDAGKRKMDQ